ncbi:MAG TPA: AAA family ATPase [Rhizomicrobium sp.]|jgi:predicted ATPase
MRRYILTGTPGSGKTALLRALEVRGHCVVAEAATDVIALEQARGVAEPWTDPSFIGKILALQRARRQWATAPLQFHDRSTICTAALARYLGYLEPAPEPEFYQRQVFFIRNLGHVEKTAARRISFAEALEFEAVHEQVYREQGYELIDIPPAPVETRADLVERYLRLATGT